jgi:transcriptional regulator with XRE-family HTH domain
VVSSASRVRNKTNTQIEFGKKVRFRRQQLTLTQEELAEKAGLTLSYVGSIERGERNISLGNIVALAEALTISPKELMPDLSCQQKDQAKIAFGKCLKSKREARGLTQEMLAEKAGLSVQVIALLEKGAGDVHLESILTLSKALKIKAQELLEKL